jgi:hypothetical protein
MNIEEVYTKLELVKEPALQRQFIIDYLLSKVDTLQNEPNLRASVAHDFSGLISVNYARELPEDDLLDVTLNFAGELELLEEDDEDWALLVEIIKSLE